MLTARLSSQAINKLQAAHDKMMYWGRAARSKGDCPSRDTFRRMTDRFFALVEMYVDPVAIDPLDHSARDLRRRPRENA